MDNHIWEKHYSDGLDWASPMPHPKRVESFLIAAAQARPDTIAICYQDWMLTYSQLLAFCISAAASLSTLGVRRGTNLALRLGNSPQHVILFFATLLAGGCVVNLD